MITLIIGIIFSYRGFTGTNWNAGVGLVKKIFLIDNTIILDFSLKDFEKIAEGISILKIINSKILSLKYDTQIENYISEHPLENEF